MPRHDVAERCVCCAFRTRFDRAIRKANNANAAYDRAIRRVHFLAEATQAALDAGNLRLCIELSERVQHAMLHVQALRQRAVRHADRAVRVNARVVRIVQGTAKRTAPTGPTVIARTRPRTRGAGRPRAQAGRSSARSGDSGESDSDPPSPWPWKPRPTRFPVGPRCEVCLEYLLWQSGELVCANAKCPESAL